MRVFDFLPLGGGIFELEKGEDKKPREGDTLVLRYDCIETHMDRKKPEAEEFL